MMGSFQAQQMLLLVFLSDYIGQVGYNYFFNEEVNYNLKASMTHEINLWSLGISELTGLATGGLDSFKNVLTNGVRKPIFKSIITNGVDILVGTVAANYLNSEDGKPYDFWKSLAGGLIGAGLEKIIPLKFVDKFEAKLMKKMNISTNKAARIKAKIPNFTRPRTIKK